MIEQWYSPWRNYHFNATLRTWPSQSWFSAELQVTSIVGLSSCINGSILRKETATKNHINLSKGQCGKQHPHDKGSQGEFGKRKVWKFLFPIEIFLAHWVSPIKRRLEHRRRQKFKWDKITTVGFVAGLLCQMSKLAAISGLCWPPRPHPHAELHLNPYPCCVSNCFQKGGHWSAEIIKLNSIKHIAFPWA